MNLRPNLLSLALLLLIILSACSNPAANLAEAQKAREALQIENGQLKEQLEISSKRIGRLEKELQSKTEEWALESDKFSEEAQKQQKQMEALTANNQLLSNELSEFQKTGTMETRTEATGSQVDELRTRDGETYKNVTIRSVVPDGLHIVHQTGATKILFTNLDPAWGDRFGYNTKEAKAYSDQQAQQKAEVQKAQLAAFEEQQAAERAAYDKKNPSNKKKVKEEDPVKKQLKALRSQLYTELEEVNSATKGNLSIIRSEPENSACFSNNLLTLRLAHAKDLRDEIINLKRQNGL